MATIMTREQLLDVVREAINATLNCTDDQLTEEADLIGDLGCDSLQVVAILMEIEEELDIDLEQDSEISDAIGTIGTAGKLSIGKIVDGIERHYQS